jgi:multiple sugar transport system permease protein
VAKRAADVVVLRRPGLRAMPWSGSRLGAPAAAWALRVVLLVFCGFPLYWMIVSSVKSPVELLASPPTLWPQELSLRTYVKLFTETNFTTYFWNSIAVSGATTAVVVLLGCLGGYSLTRYRFPGREKVAKLLLLVYMFPPIILVVPLFMFAHRFGLTNSRIGISLAYISFALPYALWILRAFFQSLPAELEEAAMTDGASRLQACAYVVVPLALPGVIATAIFTFIVAWNDFLFASVLTGRDELKTLPVGINDFFHMALVDWGLVMAAGVMVTIPALVLFVLVQQYLIAGWGAGGLKG